MGGRLGEFKDLTGQKFGKWIVLYNIKKKNKNYWFCQCECGNTQEIQTCRLMQDNIGGCRNCAHYENVVGKKFGLLTIIKIAIKPDNIKTREKYWECQCDCGNIRICSLRSLKGVECPSCGCYTKELLSQGSKKKYKEASFNQVYNSYRNNARKRNIIFNLSKDFILNIIQENCYYCDSEPNNILKNYFNNGNFIYNGIDRVKNEIGYIESNVVPCCWNCNNMKGKMSQEEFYLHMDKIYNHIHRLNKEENK